MRLNRRALTPKIDLSGEKWALCRGIQSAERTQSFSRKRLKVHCHKMKEWRIEIDGQITYHRRAIL